MKLKTFLTKEYDLDMYDGMIDRNLPAFCGPCKLTETGRRYFAPILDLDVSINGAYCEATVDVQTEPQSDMLHELLWYFAGYCTDEEYNLYFDEEDE